MRKLRVLSLFAGIGGLELGLEMTGGFETCLQVEIEPYPRSVLEKRWPGVMKWPDVRTLFAAASPARTSASPANEPALKVNAPVFGKSTGESFAQYDRQSSLWKTSVGCFPWGSDEYSATWPTSGTMRNGRCFRLRPKGLRTGGSASSSWPTPVANDDNKSVEAHLAMKARMKGGPRKTITSLNVATKADARGMWPTPRANDPEKRGNFALEKRNGLPAAAKMWPTPEKADGQRGSLGHMRGNPTLLGAAKMWPTPAVQDSANNAGPSQWERNSDPLNVAVKRLPTPSVSDANGPCKHGDGGPDLRTAVAGEGQLNPDWVETLMGFPVGWSDTECAEPEDRDFRTRWQDGTWEDGIPRLTKRKDLRRHRLMALGNGVVPQCAETIGRAILRAIERGDDGKR